MPPQGMFYDDLIEEYLCNRLNAFQRHQLEEALQQDVDLRFEYRWQQDIIRCIQLYRKQQLKHRLDTVSC
jgi:hypothetical protein